MWSLLVFLVVGLIAGFIARAVVPGDDSMGIIGTLILGVVGSFVGGALGSLLSGEGFDITNAAGIIGSVIGAILVLIAYNAITGRKRA
ncbi:GlsB/YeaQ/YmgE family stress response membrane protein [Aeromicrobium phragmitis]|uniref:GlsB/YeaQ/YmgE family stress response membrane protein n=1 Tax=Aeromicrobium phragmitis TaxID=2478914 RepID=A0A3L8PPL0_9ACTN|nr:GlsB/YeaQ/YmgE family stress response membrane protein [Aeromicrobium phragmitis]RLV57317.1 GlsB/YeaQ/YmgE family stress response membrane protein [Aeromicrobium phragmitis]